MKEFHTGYNLIRQNWRFKSSSMGFLGNPNPIKLGRCIKELERIYGIREGSHNEKGNNRIGEPNNSVDQIVQSDIAAKFQMSVDTLQNYKRLAEMIPELEDFYGFPTKK